MRDDLNYFAYGSNMSTSRLTTRLGSVELLGRATLVDYEHRFTKLGRDGSAKGNIEVAVGSIVHGVAYRIDHVQLERLAVHEGGYRQLELELEIEALGAAMVAQSFCALRPVTGLTPSPDYIEHYRVGAREHALPEDYVRRILAGLI
jgi:cation transport regulator ChaC